MISTKKCLICKDGRRNDCLHWHVGDDGGYWVWCQGKCQRAYSIRQYCHQAGIDMPTFLKGGDFTFKEAPPNELTPMEFPKRFIPLSDPRSAPGVEYIKSRGLSPQGDMYYDIEREGIVFPYYFENHFCGAQTRFIVPKVHPDGEIQKIDTVPGTRLGLLFGLWNQTRFVTNIKAVVVCEGYINALSLQQAFNLKYGGVSNNPWKFLCTSGAGISAHHKETLKELKDQNIKVIAALDTDDAGMKGLKKLKEAGAISHYALTGRTEDWNDLLKEMTPNDLAEFFLSTVRKI